MKTLKPGLFSLGLVVIGWLAGCSATSTKTADVSDSIRTSLDKAGHEVLVANTPRDRAITHNASKSDRLDAEKAGSLCSGGPERSCTPSATEASTFSQHHSQR